MKQGVLNEKLRTLFEVLRDADKADDPVLEIKTAIKKDGRIATILGYALNPNFKMPLPDGIPPYIPSQHPIGIAPLEILHTHNKMYMMYSKDLKQFKKEEYFVQWVEMMAPQEAEMMVAIKDQTLPSLYQNLTTDVFVSALGWDLDKYHKIVSDHRNKQ